MFLWSLAILPTLQTSSYTGEQVCFPSLSCSRELLAWDIKHTPRDFQCFGNNHGEVSWVFSLFHLLLAGKTSNALCHQDICVHIQGPWLHSQWVAHFDLNHFLFLVLKKFFPFQMLEKQGKQEKEALYIYYLFWNFIEN